MLAWIACTALNTSGGTLPAIRANCSAIAFPRSADRRPERRSMPFGGGVASAPTPYRPTVTTGHTDPTTPPRYSPRPPSAPTQPTMFLFEYRYRSSRSRSRPPPEPSLVATDFLESVLQRAAGRVEELAAGRVGDLPQFARIGLTEPDRERPDRPHVRRQGVEPGQELAYWRAGIVLAVGHQHD